MRFMIVVFLLAAHAVNAQDEPPAPKMLTPGNGVELTTMRCAICHDATHITRTRLSRGEWEFSIKNMIERGAPIAQNEIAPILEYLATYYNRDVAAPAPALGTAAADPITGLLGTNACTACHATDRRLVGPSFKEVAVKYSSDNMATTRLTAKIRQGGAGVWGTVPMPPNAAISDAGLQLLVDWILQQQ